MLGLPTNSWNPNENQSFSQEYSLDIFTATATAFRTSKYQDCKSDDDLFFNKDFFAQIASLTSWFHRSVLLSLPATNLNHFNPQFSTADEIIPVQNNNHFVLMSSETFKVIGIS